MQGGMRGLMGDPDAREKLQDFGLSLGLAAAIAAGFLSWGGAGRSAALSALAGGLLIAAATLRPQALAPVEQAWTRASGCWRRTCETIASSLERLLRIPGPKRPE
jgi:hypothetical protein